MKRKAETTSAPVPNEPRTYTQRVRAEQAEDASARILEAAERLFSREPLDHVTLDTIAREAGVSVPTLQRRHGSKEGIFWAVAEHVKDRIASQRAQPVLGATDANLAKLVTHYELEGRTVWHLLRQEEDSPLLASALTEARALHRRWVEAAFGKGTRERTDALVAATDLFLWKLLRLDLGRSERAVIAVMTRLVEGIVNGGNP